jgi:hypothetical protein
LGRQIKSERERKKENDRKTTIIGDDKFKRRYTEFCADSFPGVATVVIGTKTITPAVSTFPRIQSALSTQSYRLTL